MQTAYCKLHQNVSKFHFDGFADYYHIVTWEFANKLLPLLLLLITIDIISPQHYSLDFSGS